MPEMSRRERLRIETRLSIKQVARRLLVDHGASAVTLRAVARQVGMSAPALYRYFPSHDQLLAAVTGDVCDEVVSVMEGARDAVPEDRPGARLAAVCHGFRRWALEHPSEFGLLFAEPPGGPRGAAAVGTPLGKGALSDARFGRIFSSLFEELWRWHPFRVPADGALERHVLDELSACARTLDVELPPGGVYVFLGCWARLYGLVSLEVFGLLGWAMQDTAPLFDLALDDMLSELDAAPAAR